MTENCYIQKISLNLLDINQRHYSGSEFYVKTVNENTNQDIALSPSSSNVFLHQFLEKSNTSGLTYYKKFFQLRLLEEPSKRDKIKYESKDSVGKNNPCLYQQVELPSF